MNTELNLRQLQPSHMEDMVRIHKEAFPTSAWTKLGNRVIEEYYLWHLQGPHPIVRAVGAFLIDECVGFCVSGIFNGSTSGFLSRNRNLLLLKLATKPWLALDPIFANKVRSGYRILTNSRKRKDSRKSQHLLAELASFGVLSLAVDPARQGLGLGHALMHDAEETASSLGYKQMDLTVNPKNHGAIRFYERLKWQKRYQNDTWTGLMIKTL